MPPCNATSLEHPHSGVDWLRKGVPEDLRMPVGQREQKRGLQARDPIEAKQRHAEALAEIEARWANLHAGPKVLTEPEAHQIAIVVHDRWLERHMDNPSQQTAWNVDLSDRVFKASKAPKSFDFPDSILEAEVDADALQVIRWRNGDAVMVITHRALLLTEVLVMKEKLPANVV